MPIRPHVPDPPSCPPAAGHSSADVATTRAAADSVHTQLSEILAEAEFAAVSDRLLMVRGDTLAQALRAVNAVLTPDQRIRLGAVQERPAGRLSNDRLRRFRHPWMLQRMHVRKADGELAEHVVIPAADFTGLVAEVLAHRGPSVGRGLKPGEPRTGSPELIDALPASSNPNARREDAP